jgi:drug/metabolite transporter (DMT)-like permease
MNGQQRRRIPKWLVLGIVGILSGLAMLLLFRSIPMAAGTTATVMIAVVAHKHLALFIAVSSPLAALFQSVKPRLRELCGRPPEDFR